MSLAGPAIGHAPKLCSERFRADASVQDIGFYTASSISRALADYSDRVLGAKGQGLSIPADDAGQV